MQDPLAEDGFYDGTEKPWIHPSLYHASTRVSRSQLIKILRSPHDYKFSLTHEVKQTDAMLRGDAVHAAYLEPDRFQTEYAIQPDFGDCRFREAKAARDLWRAEVRGKVVVGGKAGVEAAACIAALFADPGCMSLVEGYSLKEATACWTEEVNGSQVQLRCRPDLITFPNSGPFVWDLKTVSDATPDGFSSTITGDLLHIQAAMYLDGLTAATGIGHERFGFVVVETGGSNLCGTYELEPEDIDLGRDQYQAALERLVKATASNTFPGFTDRVHTVGLKPWYRHQTIETLNGEA